MADVTGSLGGESIRLRGMALEDTQERMLEKISQLLDATKLAHKISDTQLRNVDRALEAAERSAKGLSDAAGNSAGKLNEFKDTILGGVSKAYDILSGTLVATIRTVRGMDSNIDDASFSIRAMSQNLRGGAADVARFAAESVGQLQEQYRSFKQMSNVGGVLTTDFQNLREVSARMGLTMDQYAGLMQDNFLNLRVGGNTVSKSMKNLSIAVEGMRSDSDLTQLFGRLGISVNDFGQTVLQMTAMNRGLNDESVKNTTTFNKSIRDAVLSTIGLADAFGIERNKMMEAQKKALEDVRLQNLFKNLTDVPEGVKTKALNTFLGLTGGDMAKATSLAVATFTGYVNQEAAGFMAGGGDLIMAQIKRDAEALERREINDEEYARRFQENLRNVTSAFDNVAGATLMFAAGENKAIQAQIMMADTLRRFSVDRTIIDGAQTKTGHELIDSLTDMQKQNISMAITSAKANEALNTFGLTAAYASQILSNMLLSSSGGFMEGMKENKEFKDAIAKLNERSRQAIDFMDFEKGGRELGDKAAEQFIGGINSRLGVSTRTDTPPDRSQAQPRTVGGDIMSRMVTVKTDRRGGEEQVAVRDIDKMQGQYNQGGPTSPAIKQLLGVIAGSNNIRVTGINDAYQGRSPSSAHNEGRAVDFTLSGGDYAKKRTDIINQLTNAYGLRNNEDFKVFDEANSPHGRTLGPHLHVEFSKEGAAKFQNRFQNMLQNSQGATGPGGTSSAGSTPVVPAASQQRRSEEVSQNNPAMEDVNTAVSMPSSSVNNTSNMVAIADSNLLEKLDSVRSELVNVNNSITSLGNKLEASTYG